MSLRRPAPPVADMDRKDSEQQVSSSGSEKEGRAAAAAGRGSGGRGGLLARLLCTAERQPVLLLGMLYMAQGLPFGFQAKTLPALLRQLGLSLQSVGMATLLSAPWLMKLLWAPLLDSYYLPAVGRRRTYILPCQTLLIICAILGALAGEGHLRWLLATVFLSNLAASVQDVAVDGWAVDILTEDNMAAGNVAQVVGFKLGMLVSGGLLPWVAVLLGVPLSTTFYFMAALQFVTLVLVLISTERPVTVGKLKSDDAPEEAPAEILVSPWAARWHRLKGVILQLLTQLSKPELRPLLLLIFTYKSGEVLADTMFKPFLVDQGYTPAQISIWTGQYGTITSILGSVIGGWLAKSHRIRHVLPLLLMIHVLPQAARLWLAINAGTTTPATIVNVIIVEALVGGSVTTVVFTIMMQAAEKEVGASHYTALTAVDLLGKTGAGIFSGFLASSFGYSNLFLLATALSLIPIYPAMMLVGRLRPRGRLPRPAVDDDNVDIAPAEVLKTTMELETD